MSPIEIQIRGRFHEIPGAKCRQIAGNTWEVFVPRTPEAQRLLGADLGRIDGATLGLGGVATEPALISGERPDGVVVTAWIL